MWTRTLAFHLKEREVVVSSLDPGWVQTDMGNDSGKEFEKPDRNPEEVADDILKLVTTVTESGYFWRYGKKREW